MNEQEKEILPEQTAVDGSDSVEQNIPSKNNEPQKRPVVWLVLFNIAVSLILAASILVTSVLGVSAYLFRDMRYNVNFPEPENYDELGIDTEIISKLPADKITNIALFGIDDKYKIDKKSLGKDSNRSDAIIIVSINETKTTVKLTSVLRDSWVPIDFSDGTQYEKINVAYREGGPTLAVKTLNQNFGLDISEYASVGMLQLIDVIDDIDGIELFIDEHERVIINTSCGSVPGDENYIGSPGVVHLNGAHTLAYSRIRELGSDTARAQRHQKVLKAILEKIKTRSPSELPSLIQKLLGSVETSLNYDEIMKLVPLIFESELKIETTSIPGDGVPAEGDIFEDTRGNWVWKYDLEQAKEYIHKWIYGANSES